VKDKQVEQTPYTSRIPLLSALLHCVSMTVVVFLRSGFGYSYLRPKSLFLAFSWAFGLYCLYAWEQPRVWQHQREFCLFGLASITLYLLNLIYAFARELLGSATHDKYSGTPHILRILRLVGVSPPPEFQKLWASWMEPAIVVAVSLGMKMSGSVPASLSTWLFFSAYCLWLKEALNYWFQMRQQKRQRDTFDDAEDGLGSNANSKDLDLPKPTRKPKVKRQRVW